MKLWIIIVFSTFLAGCSLWPTTEPLVVRYDSAKEDRPKLDRVRCRCDDPDVLSLGRPNAEGIDGGVSYSNDDYKIMANNTQQRIRHYKGGRGYKKCILRCVNEYNDYLDKFNE